MGIFTPGEQRNTEYLKLKYSPSTPEIYFVPYLTEKNRVEEPLKFVRREMAFHSQ